MKGSALARRPAHCWPFEESLRSFEIALTIRGPSAAQAQRRSVFGLHDLGCLLLVLGLHNTASLLDRLGESRTALAFCERALGIRHHLISRLAGSACEAELLAFGASLPRTRDLLLSISRRLACCHGQTYAVLWKTKGAITQLLENRHRIARPGFSPAVRGTNNDPDALRNRLPGGAVFLDFVRYTTFDPDTGTPGNAEAVCYAVFVIASGRAVRRVELGPAGPIDEVLTAWVQAIEDWRADLPEALRKNVLAQADYHAARLRELLWNRLTDRLPSGTTTVYLSPDGDLARLPWAALPGNKPGRALLDDYLLAVVPHGPFLLAGLLEPLPRRQLAENIVVYGGIDYDQGPHDRAPRLVSRSSGLDRDNGPRWPALPGAEDERRLVEQLARECTPGQVVSRQGRDASTAHLLDDLQSAAHAHLATHSFFAKEELEEARRLAQGAGRSPLSCAGVVLAGANTFGQDGVASGEALEELRLHGLRLCVLSACQTGVGEVTEGEGVQSLVRAFHVAGCRNVVASLWDVQDQATAALMARFYHELWQEGKHPLLALAEAQRYLRQHPETVSLSETRGRLALEKAVARPAPGRSRPVPADGPLPPKLWAAFVLSGAGR
jgi:CHAT domain-containing protein